MSEEQAENGISHQIAHQTAPDLGSSMGYDPCSVSLILQYPIDSKGIGAPSPKPRADLGWVGR